MRVTESFSDLVVNSFTVKSISDLVVADLKCLTLIAGVTRLRAGIPFAPLTLTVFRANLFQAVIGSFVTVVVFTCSAGTNLVFGDGVNRRLGPCITSGAALAPGTPTSFAIFRTHVCVTGSLPLFSMGCFACLSCSNPALCDRECLLLGARTATHTAVAPFAPFAFTILGASFFVARSRLGSVVSSYAGASSTTLLLGNHEGPGLLATSALGTA